MEVPMKRFNRFLFSLIITVGCIPFGGLLFAGTPVGRGAEQLEIELPEEGKASLGIYTPQGRLMRILEQDVDLPAGRHTVRWDGMDLKGNLIPAGTELELRVIHGPRLRAFLEFDAVQPNRPMWTGRAIGKGDEMRAGGWMGDHSAPNSITSVGNRILVGSTLVEAGHGLMMLNDEGEKMWGRKGLEGWKGPVALAGGRRYGYGVTARGQLYRFDPSGPSMDAIGNISYSSPRGVAAHDDVLYVLSRDSQRGESYLAESSIRMDFASSRPRMPRDKAPTEFHLNSQRRMATVFTNDRNAYDDTGITLQAHDGLAYTVAVARNTFQLGTVAVQREPGMRRVEVFYLPEHADMERALNPGTHVANPVSVGWRPFAAKDWNPNAENESPAFLTAADAPVNARAVLLRIRTDKAKVPLIMARLLKNRFQRVEAPVRMFSSQLTGEEKAPIASWSYSREAALSEETPERVILDYGTSQRFRGLMLMGLQNREAYIERFIGTGEPGSASDADWERLGSVSNRDYRARDNYAVNTRANDLYFDPGTEISTRAIRLVLPEGRPRGKRFTRTIRPDPNFTACAGVYLLSSPDIQDRVAPDMLEVFRIKGAGSRRPSADFNTAVPLNRKTLDIQAAPDGRLYALFEQELAELTLQGETYTARSLMDLASPVAMAVNQDRVVITDREAGLILLDRRTRQVLHQGGKYGLVKGLWDPQRVIRGEALTLDHKGRIWIAEGKLNPKRLVLFDSQGEFLKEWFGSPYYGGGGTLDPDLKSFYYKSAQFELDWENGTSRLIGIMEDHDSDQSVLLPRNTFAYPHFGPVFYREGIRYMAGPQGGNSIYVIKPDGPAPWRPACVIGTARGNRFLLERGTWGPHWAAQDLNRKGFVWSDLDDQGDFDVQEVTLFDLPEGVQNIRGMKVGPTLDARNRFFYWKPRAFTPGGAPVFDPDDLQFSSRIGQRPDWGANVRIGTRAKPNVGGNSVLTAKGNYWREGYSAVYRPDGSILGGGEEIDASGYMPAIQNRIQLPFWVVGQALTESPVGEVAVLNGDNGVWTVIAPDLGGLVVGYFFTGNKGGWGAVPDQRGFEVTDHKHGIETFSGHFVKAHNGNYYAVAGKTFQAICRVTGLDEKKLTTHAFTVSEQAFALNEAYRTRRIQAAKAAKQRRGSKRYDLIGFGKKPPRVDGTLTEWPREKFVSFGPEKNAGKFAAGTTAEGLYLAYQGRNHLGNAADELHFLWEGGFGFDFKWRNDASSLADMKSGDRRLVIAPFKGKWQAVLFDYVNESATDEEHVVFTSPVQSTFVSKVEPIPPGQIQVAVFTEPYSLENPVEAGWRAEVFIPWRRLGIGPANTKTFTADIGIIDGDNSGQEAGKRYQWSHPGPLTVSDQAAEILIEPGKWGLFRMP